MGDSSPTRVPAYQFVSAHKQAPDHCQNQSSMDLIAQVSKDQMDFIPVRKSEGRFTCRVIKSLCHCFRVSQVKVYAAPLPLIKAIIPEQSARSKGKKTLVLDLDETLVHSSFKAIEQPDVVLHLVVEEREVTIYVRFRPGLREFLEIASKHYELVVFTASLAKYADPLLDIIDTSQLIDVRLFRDSCNRDSGSYVKDLANLGRDMKKVILVDVTDMQNSPDSYRLQPENAIPIKSFFDDGEDDELFKLMSVLEELAGVEDIREILRKGDEITASCLLPSRELREEKEVKQLTDGTQTNLRWDLNSPRKP